MPGPQLACVPMHARPDYIPQCFKSERDGSDAQSAAASYVRVRVSERDGSDAQSAAVSYVRVRVSE